MKKEILFIHSAGPQGYHEGSDFLVSYIKARLGTGYTLVSPNMPDPENPHYKPWKKKFKRVLLEADDDVIVVGHSLGASVVLKYLSEKTPKKSIAGLFLIGAVYWGKENWQVEEYMLEDNFSSRLPRIPHIVFYHSKDDEVVPVSHLWYYASAIPGAVIREFDERGHLFGKGLPELIEDIKNIKSNGRSI
ncbi:MAG TPA: alpha/beta fold hydrolase [Chryseolinea sp.]|nr:alpha/beta fold hydrolase [Chryseolinea sp.]